MKQKYLKTGGHKADYSPSTPNKKALALSLNRLFHHKKAGSYSAYTLF